MSAAGLFKRGAGAALLLMLAGLAGCERPPVEVVQHGFRGTGMQVVYNPRIVEQQIPLNQPPAAAAPAPADGPKAGQVYQNVKVLGELSVAEFTRTMTSLTAWVSPQEGCGYCHNLQNLADDSKYTKVVARRMIEMTRHVNADRTAHVGATGVTCWTCHRGEPVPKQVWFKPLGQDLKANFIGDQAGQNQAARTVGLSSLPYDPFTPYLLENQPIRVNGPTALPTGNRSSIKQAEFTYGLMMHFSGSLGVNCTYCHNTQNMGVWEGGPPQRVTAWHGIQMTRELNNEYIVPLTSAFPPARLGPTGDVAKVNCATCHQGAYKPVYGAAMAKDYPAFASSVQSPAGTAMAKAAPAAMAAAVAAPPATPADPAK